MTQFSKKKTYFEKKNKAYSFKKWILEKLKKKTTWLVKSYQDFLSAKNAIDLKRLTMVLAFHKGVGIVCNSSSCEVMAVSLKIVIYIQSSPGEAIARRWLLDAEKTYFMLENKLRFAIPIISKSNVNYTFDGRFGGANALHLTMGESK